MPTDQRIHPTYNRTNFPTLVCNHGNWDIYASSNGHCAAIPTAAGEQAGCRASHFGDIDYTRRVLRQEIEQAQAQRRGDIDDTVQYAMALATEVPA